MEEKPTLQDKIIYYATLIVSIPIIIIGGKHEYFYTIATPILLTALSIFVRGKAVVIGYGRPFYFSGKGVKKSAWLLIGISIIFGGLMQLLLSFING